MKSRLQRTFRSDQPSFGMPWEPQFWDTERYRPQAVFRRCRAWIAASRPRRWTAWILIALFVVFVFPGLISAISMAQTGTVTPAAAPNSALGWMDIKDSSGVNVSSYMFVSNRGSVWSLDLGRLVLWSLIILFFAIWHPLTTTFVWLPGEALDFGWLNMFGAPLRGVAENLTAQIATPMVLVTFVTIGAVPVGWFIVRGYSAKATAQVVTMVGVAILGPVFLADPLAEVLSSHGLLAQGRDLGISVAAGLNGNSSPDPKQVVAAIQVSGADNFMRAPLQVWNFGHVVDERPACKAAWSAGVMAGDEERVKDGLKACGDSAAYAAADNPSVGQIGAGLLLLLCAIILLLFAVYMAIKIIWAALDTIYYGFMTIFGFAAGGFVYGPTQTFTVRCVVHGFISAFRMAVFVIFLGLYQLFMGSLFQQARGQVMAVFVIGAIVEIVAIVQLRRLSKSLDGGNDWIANRFSLAMQNGLSAQGAGAGGGGGGRALGMGDANASNSMGPLGVLAAATTINSSPITGWLAGRNNPLSRWAWLDQVEKKNKARGLKTRDLRAAAHASVFDRVWLANEARAGIARSRRSGRGRARHAAFAAENVSHAAGLTGGIYHSLIMAGMSEEEAQLASDVRVDIMRHADKEPLASTHLGHVVAAHKHFERDAIRNPGGTRAIARFHGLEASVDRYRGDYSGGVQLGRQRLHDVGYSYIRNPDAQFINSLRDAANSETGGLLSLAGGGTERVTQNEADRLRQWLSNEHALRVQAATNWVAQNPADLERVRVLRSEIDKAAMTNQLEAGRNITGAVSLAQPDINRTPLPVHPGNRDPHEHIPEGLLNDLRFRRP
ncbi:hypothetical protein IU459_27545 [Nocardia amamiensis]|uniref:Uncharacterized protein n=1 Tax=Nocardia amamiensis TaxID=404578 RepID=A0ABS0CXC9_9NOCA|nr:hypothetical protein [Nocardia amamiensis]MBF6301267.1 hypothetical protein [Nocardia amamiensis]